MLSRKDAKGSREFSCQAVDSCEFSCQFKPHFKTWETIIGNPNPDPNPNPNPNAATRVKLKLHLPDTN